MISPIQRLVEEIHRRSMWQVLGIYLGTSWGALEVASELIDRLILPESVFRIALALLVIGLPVILATAYFEGGHRRPTREVGAPPRVGLRRWFTWRNALFGGVAAFALLGLATAAFLASRSLGVGFAAPLIAQGVLEEREPVVLAEFENRTTDSLLARAVTEALRVDLSQSPALRLFEAAQLRNTLRLMERDVNTIVDADLAREIARRSGTKAYLVGAVDQLGASYAISARLVSAENGADLVGLRESADGANDVIGAVDRLSRKLRARMGESLRSVNAATPLPDVTTRSLPALEKMAAGSLALRAGDRERAIRLFEEAVLLDTTFASAYRALAIANSNLGNTVEFERNSALARRFAARLPLRERYLAEAAYHSARGRRDSVAYYHQLVLDTDPLDYVALNNLADSYEWMGRFDEAMSLYRRAAAVQPNAAAVRMNLASIGRTLGLHALADSAIDALEAAGTPLNAVLPSRVANAVYADRSDRLDSILAVHRGSETEETQALLEGTRGIRAALRGQAGRAMAALDSAVVSAQKENLAEIVLIVRLAHIATSIAVNEPEAAVASLEAWNLAGTVGASPVMHSRALGILAEAYALAGRYHDAERVLANADSVARAADFHQPGAVANARAVLALSRGDALLAVTEVERAIEADYGLVRHSMLLTRATALEALGRYEDAARDFEALSASHHLLWMDVLHYAALLPYAHERTGVAWLAAGDTARALQHLGKFTEMWSGADASLQPRVEAARARIEALLRGRG